MEFLKSLMEDEHKDLFLGMLDSRRRLALDHAACQEIAHTCYSPNIKPLGPVNAQSLESPSSRKEVCPWLSNTVLNDEHPYYLWDIKGKKAVVFMELALGKRPKYTCISHTWGRWRTDKYTALENVPLKIPNNSIFKVGDFARYLLASSSANCGRLCLV
jgi:hypothetical protein